MESRARFVAENYSAKINAQNDKEQVEQRYSITLNFSKIKLIYTAIKKDISRVIRKLEAPQNSAAINRVLWRADLFSSFERHAFRVQLTKRRQGDDAGRHLVDKRVVSSARRFAPTPRKTSLRHFFIRSTSRFPKVLLEEISGAGTNAPHPSRH